MASKPKTTYQFELLDGTRRIFRSTLELAWVVVTEDRQDWPWTDGRFGYYATSADRTRIERKRAEAAGITGDHGFARVEVRPIIKL